MKCGIEYIDQMCFRFNTFRDLLSPDRDSKSKVRLLPTDKGEYMFNWLFVVENLHSNLKLEFGAIFNPIVKTIMPPALPIAQYVSKIPHHTLYQWYAIFTQSFIS